MISFGFFILIGFALIVLLAGDKRRVMELPATHMAALLIMWPAVVAFQLYERSVMLSSFLKKWWTKGLLLLARFGNRLGDRVGLR